MACKGCVPLGSWPPLAASCRPLATNDRPQISQIPAQATFNFLLGPDFVEQNRTRCVRWASSPLPVAGDVLEWVRTCLG